MARLQAILSLLVVAIVLSVAVAAAAADESSEKKKLILDTIGRSRESLSFTNFAIKFEKNYESEEEMKMRFRIFQDNLDLIRSTNRKRLSYRLGINRFADTTWEEFQATRLGAAQKCSATLEGNHKLTDEILPATRDWRKNGIVSPVKDQGNCGSCWTFSATGSLEAAYTQATGKNISLSEQQLVDCANAFKNNGCNGGLPSQAFEYVKYNGGLETEQSYPYTATDGTCGFKPNDVGVKVTDIVNITMDAENELKHAVGVVRPVSVAFEVVNSFMLYKEGVYTSDTCGTSPMDVNHAVLAVGYGVENGVPYWIIKNSWGLDWGLHGYFMMELGKNMCGVATCASYPVVAA